MYSKKNIESAIRAAVLRLVSRDEIETAQELLNRLDYAQLAQAVCGKAEKVYQYRMFGNDEGVFHYFGQELLAQQGTLLMCIPKFRVEHCVTNVYILEIWLLADMNTVAVSNMRCISGCKENIYVNEYRTLKGELTEDCIRELNLNLSDIVSALEMLSAERPLKFYEL